MGHLRRWFPAIFKHGSAAPPVPATLPNQHTWLKADAGLFVASNGTTPVTADGDLVGFWTDQFGNGNNPIQATTTNKPTYKVNIQNALPVVRFDGNDNYLQKTFSATLTQPITVYCAVSSGTTGRLIFDSVTESAGIRVGFVAGDGSNNFNLGVSAGFATGFNVWSAVLNGASTLVRKNGTQVGTGTFTNGTDGLTVGARYTFSSFLNGDLAELIFYSAAHNLATLQTVETYLMARYGL